MRTIKVVTPPSNQDNGSGKGKNRLQSVSLNVNNSVSESIPIMIVMGSNYDNIVAPIGPSSTPYSEPYTITGVQINGTSIPYGTNTNVTLPDSRVIIVYWSTDGITTMITCSGG
ncbi:MAG: hypothetical protein JSS75_01710 [Bacteroidetes bacterium]|nr:hypothetical protein [Bacteroidota bacterium]